MNHNGSAVEGGAIYLWAGENAPLKIIDCVFESNTTTRTRFDGGGAIWCTGPCTLQRCLFRGNRSNEEGGAVEAHGQLLVESCEFDVPEQGIWSAHGAAIYTYSFGPIEIRNSSFEVTAGLGQGAVIAIDFQGQAVVTGNTFKTRNYSTAGFVVLFGGLTPTEHHGYGRVVMTDNVVWNVGSVRGIVGVGRPEGDVEVSRNTFVDCDVQVSARGGTVTVSRNLVYEGELLVNGDGQATCNCVWPESLRTTSGNVVFERNVVKNPLVCDPDAEDFSVSIHSPCTAENSPAGCGLIGALDPTCDLTTVLRRTWGQIKRNYRDGD